MTIVCGTDFTAGAEVGLSAAASLAVLRDEELVIVHALQSPADALLLVKPKGSSTKRISEQLEDLRVGLRDLLAEQARRVATSGLRVRTELLDGAPDEALVAFAEQHKSSLIVVGALGRRSALLWRLGSTADRVAQIARIPVWIARESPALEAWRKRERALRILISADLSPTSDAAAAWATGFAALGASELVAAHVYWPPEKARATDASAGGGSRARSLPIGSGTNDVAQELEAELRARLAPIVGQHPLALRVIGGLGRPADHIVRAAETERCDLIAVGTHQREGLTRFWHGSVSQNVIALATQHVVSVPQESSVG